MTDPLARGIHRLEAGHDLSDFDCGHPALDTWLKRHALANDRAGSARTFVALRENRVVAFFSLAAGSVAYDEMPERARKGLARHVIPVVLLARLAVDRKEQGCGLGAGLLKSAMRKCEEVSRLIGLRAVVVDAKDPQAEAFYERYGFVKMAPGRLYWLMKDIRAMLRGEANSPL